MPTGYTAAVCDGEITSLRDFALLCARGMGALVTMRDDPLSAPIPDQIKPDTEYDEKMLEQAKALLVELDGLTPEECEQRAQAEYEQLVASNRQRKEVRDIENARLDAMIAKVRAWSTEADGIKQFMLEQLLASHLGDHVYEPEKIAGEAWRAGMRQDALRSISRHGKNIAEEIHRTMLRNQWLFDLRTSLEGCD